MFALPLLALCANAQSKVVTGKVTDSKDGSPLVSATVTVKGTQTGTTTAADGTFKITVPQESTTLVISSIGFATQEVKIGSGAINVVMVSSSNTLTDVVVIGYGSSKKKELTGSVVSLGEKDFQKGTITSPDQLIAGKIAGVQVISNGGAPGSGSIIRIRGGASLNASNDPLFVIDGIPLTGDGVAGVSNPLALINPNDIENITILKDAASTAIYGSRASNGVILITTKKGKKGATKINFNTVLSVSSIVKQLDVMGAEQFRNFVNTNPKSTDANKALLGSSNTDWQKEIFQDAVTSDNNLNITGAVANIPYRVSLGYLNQQGILKTDKLQRTTAGISLTPMLFDNHLKIDINVKGAYSESNFANQGAIGSAITFDPTQPVYDSKGNYFEWGQGNGFNPLATANPVALLYQQNSVGKAFRSFGNAQFDYKTHFLPDLHVNLNLGYDATDGHGNYSTEDSAKQAYAIDGAYRGTKGQYQQYKTYTFSELYLNYVKDIKSINSNINLIGGYGYYNNRSANYGFYSFFLNGDTVPNSKPTAPLYIDQQTLLSYYSRLRFTVAGKYVFAASVRTDGSSRFAKGNRWGTFPTGAFTWIINKESFLNNSKIVSDLKLRLSYGVTGQQDGIGYYNYLAAYYPNSNVSQYQLGSTFYNLYSPAPYAADIKWETTEAYNLGLDFGFAKNRITGSVDFYQKKTRDLLNTFFVPAGTNFSNLITDNVGNMDTKGIEVLLNVTPVSTRNFRWDLSYNFSYNKRKITKLTLNDDPNFKGNSVGGISGGTGQTIQIQSVGYEPNSFLVYKQVYDEKTGAPIEGLYADLNRDGQINDNDLYHYKSPFAPYLMGLTNSFTYKQWSLNMVMRANIGNYMYNNVQSNLGVSRNILNPNGYLQNAPTSLFETNFYNNQFKSDYYIQNASFLKMDNIGLSYNVGKIMKDKANLVVGLNCQNVFVITKYSGIDPEIFGGIDNNIYPRPRIYSLNLNIGF